MFKRYTEKAKKAIMIAQEEAVNLNHDYIGTEHILIGLLKEEEGVASQVLKQLGVPLIKRDNVWWVQVNRHLVEAKGK